MDNIVLYDGSQWSNLLPLTFTKPVAELRMGILTFKERWEKITNSKIALITQEYLTKKYSFNIPNEAVFINAAFFPTKELVQEISSLKKMSL